MKIKSQLLHYYEELYDGKPCHYLYMYDLEGIYTVLSVFNDLKDHSINTIIESFTNYYEAADYIKYDLHVYAEDLLDERDYD